MVSEKRHKVIMGLYLFIHYIFFRGLIPRKRKKRSISQVFQRRQTGAINFFLDWRSYQIGFGRPGGEFWLGMGK